MTNEAALLSDALLGVIVTVKGMEKRAEDPEVKEALKPLIEELHAAANLLDEIAAKKETPDR